MKKTLFFALLACVGFASCSEDVEEDINIGRPIEFTAAVSRATETTTSNITSATVYAFEGTNTFFGKTAFTGTSAALNSTTKYYWPASDKVLTFFAFNPDPTTLGGTLTVTSAAQTLVGYTSPNADGQKDICFVKATGKKSTSMTAGVALPFAHMTSEVIIQAKNSAAAGRVVTIDSISLMNVLSVGDLNYATGAWTNTKTKKAFNKKITAVTVSDATAKTLLGAMFHIPQTATAWTGTADRTNSKAGTYVVMRLNVKQGSTQIYPSSGNATVAVPLGGTWERGKKYTYVLDFATGAGFIPPKADTGGDAVLGSPIMFTCSVTAMGTGTPTNPTL